MSQVSLLSLVKEDINKFFKQSNKIVFCNECDFQMHLALYLKSNEEYDDVDLEYLIPDSFLKNLGSTHKERISIYPWLNAENRKTNLYIDIVVRKGNHFLPIELKFNTTRFVGKQDCLGVLVEDAEILRKQGAEDLTMYNTWKDVRRLEVLKKLSPESVKNGLAVLLTNDAFYQKKRNPNSKNYQFSLEDKVWHKSDKHWNVASSVLKHHPSFTLDQEYFVTWMNTEFHTNGTSECSIPFYYCMIEV